MFKDAHVDKKLFTPGPISTSRTVKEAMLVDLGSRDNEFLDVLQFVKEKLLAIAGKENYIIIVCFINCFNCIIITSNFLVGASNTSHSLIIVQGSGTFGVESVIQSTAAPTTNYLILENGAYGARMSKMCEYLNIKHSSLTFDENKTICLDRLEKFLRSNKNKFTHVVIHQLLFFNITKLKCK